MWSVYIQSKSDNTCRVNDLKSITKIAGGKRTEIEDFSQFVLSTNQALTFIGSTTIVSIKSEDIEFVQFDEKTD